MNSHLKVVVLAVMTTVSSVSCTCFANNGDSTMSVSDTDTTSLDSKYCRTFGFRSWALVQEEGLLTLSGEAMMPTPAWAVVLHRDEVADNGQIQFVVETVEPSGLSSSVVTWISFNASVNAIESPQPVVQVSCAGEIVWSSEKAESGQ